MPRATRVSSDEEMEDASQPAATSGKGKGRQPTVEEDELDEDESDEEIEGDAEDLRYDPDQKLEEKRRVRAQYRELLGQQDGARVSFVFFVLDRTDGDISTNMDPQNTAQATLNSVLPTSWQTSGKRIGISNKVSLCSLFPHHLHLNLIYASSFSQSTPRSNPRLESNAPKRRNGRCHGPSHEARYRGV